MCRNDGVRAEPMRPMIKFSVFRLAAMGVLLLYGLMVTSYACVLAEPPKVSSVRFRVKILKDGIPVPSTVVIVYRRDEKDEEVERWSTDTDGTVEIVGLQPGKYILRPSVQDGIADGLSVDSVGPESSE